MPSNVEGGILGNGNASVEAQELSPWQNATWDPSSTVGPPAKRSGFLLRLLLWPLSRLRDIGSKSSSFGADAANAQNVRSLRATAYLDGLRGFAAFLVYIHHHELWAHSASTAGDNEWFENSYGYKGNHRFVTLPFVRNFFTGGHMAVATFYVISGYVLSAKPLSLMQAGEHLRMYDSMASSIFRRWFRLYFPIVVTTFVYVTSWHIFGIWTAAAEPKGSVIDEWWNWYVELKNFSFIFKEGPVWVTYNTHLWSIPLEMRGSLAIFCAVLALSRATTRARHLCMLALMVYFLYIVDGYYCALFMMGMLQCDLDLMAKRSDPEYPSILRFFEPYKKPLFYILFVLSMYLAGVPSQTNQVELLRANPGWYYLSFLKPQAVFDPKWFFLFFAATFLVACVSRLPWLRRFFETRFCQYLGRVSYSLYLVHGPILTVIGDRVYCMVGWVRPFEEHQKKLARYLNLFPLPRVGPMGLEISFLLPHIILLPLTFWVADIVTRFVDEPSVRLSNWMYKAILADMASTQPKPEDVQRLA